MPELKNQIYARSIPLSAHDVSEVGQAFGAITHRGRRKALLGRGLAGFVWMYEMPVSEELTPDQKRIIRDKGLVAYSL